MNHHGLYSFTYMLVTQVYLMMSPSCMGQICTKLTLIFLHIDEYLSESINMYQIGRCELVLRHDLNVINVHKKIHVSYKMRVEWRIKGLNRKWKQLMKRFNSIKPKYNHLFHVKLSWQTFYTYVWWTSHIKLSTTRLNT
jgi:hypothetical protein